MELSLEVDKAYEADNKSKWRIEEAVRINCKTMFVGTCIEDNNPENVGLNELFNEDGTLSAYADGENQNGRALVKSIKYEKDYSYIVVVYKNSVDYICTCALSKGVGSFDKIIDTTRVGHQFLDFKGTTVLSIERYSVKIEM